MLIRKIGYETIIVIMFSDFEFMLIVNVITNYGRGNVLEGFRVQNFCLLNYGESIWHLPFYMPYDTLSWLRYIFSLLWYEGWLHLKQAMSAWLHLAASPLMHNTVGLRFPSCSWSSCPSLTWCIRSAAHYVFLKPVTSFPQHMRPLYDIFFKLSCHMAEDYLFQLSV